MEIERTMVAAIRLLLSTREADKLAHIVSGFQVELEAGNQGRGSFIDDQIKFCNDLRSVLKGDS